MFGVMIPSAPAQSYPQDGFHWANKSEPDTSKPYPWDAIREEQTKEQS